MGPKKGELHVLFQVHFCQICTRNDHVSLDEHPLPAPFIFFFCLMLNVFFFNAVEKNSLLLLLFGPISTPFGSKQASKRHLSAPVSLFSQEPYQSAFEQ